MTWKTLMGCGMAALVIGVLDSLIGLSHAAILALGGLAIAAIAVTTLPDAGGLRRPRER